MSTQTVMVLSGPNLNLLGEREPEVYGAETLDDHLAVATEAATAHGLAIDHLQSNHEGELVDAIHAARANCAAIVINPGAFTHYAGPSTTPSPPLTGPSSRCTCPTRQPASRGATPRSWHR